MGGSDQPLLLVLPPLAILAAFSLPTLKRAAAAAIDWFSVCFFSAFAIVIWVVYVSMQTGIPAQPARNIERLAPQYVHQFSALALALAIVGTLAWLWLVKWRTGRSRHPLWKSLVLPAGGVALCWLLAMSLLLLPLDRARGFRQQVQRIALLVPTDACIAAPGMSRAQVVALEQLGHYRVDAVTPISDTSCEFLLLAPGPPQSQGAPAGWQWLGRERRNNSDEEQTLLYRRNAGP
jgi:hypothetical protein